MFPTVMLRFDDGTPIGWDRYVCEGCPGLYIGPNAAFVKAQHAQIARQQC